MLLTKSVKLCYRLFHCFQGSLLNVGVRSRHKKNLLLPPGVMLTESMLDQRSWVVLIWKGGCCNIVLWESNEVQRCNISVSSIQKLPDCWFGAGVSFPVVFWSRCIPLCRWLDDKQRKGYPKMQLLQLPFISLSVCPGWSWHLPCVNRHSLAVWGYACKSVKN